MRKYIILMAIATAVVSFLLGLYLYKLNKINEQIAFEAEYGKIQSENIINEAENLIKETSTAQNKTTPNTRLIEKRYYIDCGHLVEEEKEIEENLINKEEEEFKNEYTGWEIQKFTPTEVVVYKEIHDFCNQHYLLKELDGEIVVYRLDKYDNKKNIEKSTGIQTMYLSEIDIENLKKGIKVCGKKEMNKMLEDFE